MSRRIPPPLPELSDELREARRAVESIEQFTLLRDWEWHRSSQNWVLHCRLSPDVQTGSPIPPATDWFIHVSPAYPFGEIKFFPAKESGLTATFPHQKYNEAGDEDLPWGTGSLCLDTPAHSFGRRELSDEPYEAHRRLRWHIQRACRWLEDASRGKLSLPGEPFELPDFHSAKPQPFSVAFSESSDSFATWNQVAEQVGIVEYYVLRRKLRVHVARSFQTLDGRELGYCAWGPSITGEASSISRGLWLRLKEVPILPPWQAPQTWGELRRCAERQGVDLDSLLRLVFDTFGQSKEIGRIALIGFPLPARFGDPPERMHWQSLWLPELNFREDQVRGFRPRRRSAWQNNRERVLHDSAAVNWLQSENWHSDQLTTRGALPMNLSSKKVILLGAGAIGSAVAEMLVRAGISRMLILDGDLFKAGNLVRHTLDLRDLNDHKAVAVAKRLNQVSPHTVVEALNCSYPPVSASENRLLKDYEVVIDCTGDDEVLHHLASFDWGSEKFFFSVAMSLGAKRLYCFSAYGDSFPVDSFRLQIAPWLGKDRSENFGVEMPREGIGCWHPVFPARADDVWLLASMVVKQFEQNAASQLKESKLTVYEQTIDADGLFSGINKVT